MISYPGTFKWNPFISRLSTDGTGHLAEDLSPYGLITSAVLTLPSVIQLPRDMEE